MSATPNAIPEEVLIEWRKSFVDPLRERISKLESEMLQIEDALARSGKSSFGHWGNDGRWHIDGSAIARFVVDIFDSIHDKDARIAQLEKTLVDLVIANHK